jgi:hypothetical protein
MVTLQSLFPYNLPIAMKRFTLELMLALLPFTALWAGNGKALDTQRIQNRLLHQGNLREFN